MPQKAATRLVNIIVKNVAAVDKPANRRTWLLLKAETADIKSESERRRILDQAVRDKWGSTTDWGKAYLDDVWDGDEAIICKDGAYFSAPFTINADSRVEFGDLTPVTREWVAKRQREVFAKKAWDAAYINDLPDSSFALVTAGGKKDDDGKTAPRSLRLLPYKDADGAVDLPHLRNALARLDQIDASDAEKAKARKVLQAAAKDAGVGQAAEKSMTFDDALLGRNLGEVCEELSEQYGALMQALYSIRDDEQEANKGAAMKQALADFLASLTAAMPDIAALVDDSAPMEKVGRTISAERLSTLKLLVKTIEDTISEQETKMADKKAPDASALSKMGASIAAMFGRVSGADEATVAALEKAATGEPEPAPIPAAMQELMAKAQTAIDGLTAQNVELKKSLETTTTELAAMREQNELRKFAEEVTGYKDIGLDPAKDAALLKNVEEKVGKESADRLREVFKAQLAQKAASKLLGEVGSSGAGMPETSATAEIERKLGEVMSKNDKLDRAAALDLVYREHPDLYERQRQENAVKV